jgi:phospholipase C
VEQRPFKTLAEAAQGTDLAPADLDLLTTGASGLPTNSVDTRVTNATQLPNGPFQLNRMRPQPTTRPC